MSNDNNLNNQEPTNFNEAAPQVSASLDEVATTQEPTVKKSSKGKFIFGGVAIAAIIGLVVFFSSGSVALGSAYQRAETRWIDALLVELSTEDAMEETITISYIPSEGLNQMMGLMMDMEIPEIELIWRTVSDMSINTLSTIDAVIDGDVIPTIQIMIDLLSGYYINVPDASNYFIYLPIFDGGFNGLNIEEAFSQQEILELFKNLTDVYFDTIEDIVVREPNAELAAANVSVTATRYSIDFTLDLLKELATLSIDVLAESAFAQFILEAVAYDLGEEITMVELVELLHEELENVSGTDVLATMHVYVANDQIIGRIIELEIDGFALSIIYKNIVDGNDMYFALKLTGEDEWDEISLGFAGEFTNNGTGFSGSPSIFFDDGFDSFEFSFDVIEMRTDGDFVLGAINISGAIDDPFMPITYDITIDFTREDNIQLITTTGDVGLFGFFTGDIGTLIITYERNLNPEFEMPIFDPNYVIDFTSADWHEAQERMERFESDLLDYAQNNFTGLLGDLLSMLMW